MLLSIVVYAVSFLLIRLLSRYRELSADRSGALLTGQPHALASALMKVTGDMGQDPHQGPARGRAAERVLLCAGASGLARAWPRSSPRTRRWNERLKELDKISKQLGQ